MLDRVGNELTTSTSISMHTPASPANGHSVIPILIKSLCDCVCTRDELCCAHWGRTRITWILYVSETFSFAATTKGRIQKIEQFIYWINSLSASVCVCRQNGVKKPKNIDEKKTKNLIFTVRTSAFGICHCSERCAVELNDKRKPEKNRVVFCRISWNGKLIEIILFD